MGTGYTRNDTANNIADGNVINASDLDGEFDAIQAAFNATTGHSHDGTTGEGPQIGTGGIADLAVTTGKIANDAVTLGTKTSGNYVATGAVSGVGLSGSASAEGATFTVTSNATDANTASTIVARDASGNFSAGTITANLSGNATTATTATTANSVAADSVALGTDTTGNYVAAGAVSGVGLSGSASSEGATFTVTSNATSANTASTIVARDASGNFSAGTITANLTGTASNATNAADAALLDSLDSTQFLRSDAADTKTAGDLSFADNVKAVFGAGGDFEIVHTGTNTNLRENGTGNLNVWGDDIYFYNSAGTETKASYLSNGAVTLYYDNSPKLATTSGGIDVTGTVTADGLTVSTDSYRQLLLTYPDAFTSKLQVGFSNFYVQGSSTTDELTIANNSSGQTKFINQSKASLLIDNSNDISFYDSTGSSQSFYWDASEVRLGLGTTSPARNLHLYAENSDASVRFENTANSKVFEINPSIPGVANTGLSIVNVTDNTVPLHVDNSGNVGIGVSTVSGKLHLSESGATNAAATIFSLDGYHSTFGANLAKSSGTYTTPATSLSGGAWEYQPVNSLNGHGQMIYLSAPDTNSSAATPLERLRIDNSGNFLLGKSTASGANTEGVELRPTLSTFTSDGGTAVYVSRLTNNGDLISFEKDSTAVGSIGVDGGDNLYLTGESGNTGGIYMNDAAVSPAYQGAERDAYYDLGKGAARWKNLHLSGQANVGTAVAATQSASVTGSTTLDFSTYQNFILTMTGNITLAQPSTEQAGQSGFIIFIHSGAARTVSLGADYETAGASGLTLSGASGAVDLVPYVVQSSGNILLGAPQLAFA
jgi:hypothetical protein